MADDFFRISQKDPGGTSWESLLESRLSCAYAGPRSSGSALNIGVGAHITAASAGGPRYDLLTF